jgi:hypothetical protein
MVDKIAIASHKKATCNQWSHVAKSLWNKDSFPAEEKIQRYYRLGI